MAVDRDLVDVMVAASGSVSRLAYSPDGSLLAAARDYAVELRDGTTGRPLRVLAGHTADVRDVAFAPDGRLLASASFDHTVRVWDVPTGKTVRTLAVQYPHAVRFLPDGSRLAVATWSAGVLLFGVAGSAGVGGSASVAGAGDADGAGGAGGETGAGGEGVPLVPGLAKTMIDAVVFSPDGSLVAVLERYGRCQVYEVATGTPRLRVPGPGRGLRQRLRERGDAGRLVEVDFTGDGSALAGVTRTGAIHLWDLGTGRPRSSAVPPRKPRRPVEVAVFLPDPTRVVATAKEVVRELAVQDAETGAVVGELGADGLPIALAAAPGGRRIAGGTSEGLLLLWAEPRGEPEVLPDVAYNPLWDVAYSPDGKLLATVSNNGDAHLWEVASGRVRGHFPGELHRNVAIAFTPDGTGVAVAGPHLAPQIRELKGDRVRLTLDRPAGETRALAVSADGRQLVTADHDERVRLWDAATGTLRHTVEASADRVVFAPDGERIALVSHYSVRMWQPPSGRLTTMFPSGEGGPRVTRAVAFSADGRYAAAPADRDNVLTWSPRTGLVVRGLAEKIASAYAVALSPRGDLLAAAPFEGAPRIYDAATGARRHELTGHLARVTSLAFTPDGKSLVTGSIDGTARTWNSATGAAQSTFIPLRDGKGAAVLAGGGHLADEAADDRLWWASGLNRVAAPGRRQGRRPRKASS